jgi:hypothetical protein
MHRFDTKAVKKTKLQCRMGQTKCHRKNLTVKVARSRSRGSGGVVFGHAMPAEEGTAKCRRGFIDVDV